MPDNISKADEPSRFEQLAASVKLPTLGGMQFWTDLRWWHGWRLQQNKVTDHCRIIDDANVRHYWGDIETCRSKFGEVIRDEQWPSSPDRVVVFLHGLMRTHRSYHKLGKQVESQNLATPIYFGYASTRADVRSHAAALRSLVEGLPGNPEIHIVAHSLGNIVTRHAIADWQNDDPRSVLPRLGRIVMQGPPNQGALIAKRLRNLGLYEIIAGTSGQELGGSWEDLRVNLSTPPCEFGIVAGEIDTGPVKNPLVEGASDFVVSIEEAKLAGASDFLTVPVLHSFLMDDTDVQLATIRFLESGSFREDGTKQPIH